MLHLSYREHYADDDTVSAPKTELELSCVSIIMLSGIMMTPAIAINLTVSEAFLSPSFFQ